MAWTRTTSAQLDLPPAQVWSVISDLSRWSRWQPAVSGARLDGPVAVGATGSYSLSSRAFRALHERTAPPLQVTAHEEGRVLEISQPNPTGEMRVRWTLDAVDDATRLEQVVSVHGAMTPAVVLGVAGALAQDFSTTSARLALECGLSPDPSRVKVVVAGGSGALGRLLAGDLLRHRHEVVLLTRSPDASLPYRQVQWDGRTVGAWADELEATADAGVALVNLAGRLVDVRPSPANIASLRTSRVEPTHALVSASQQLQRPLVSWLQASTTAIWSDSGEERITETTPLPADGGLPQMTGVAQPWEAAVDGARAEHVHLLRTSIVLDRDAPALQVLARLTRAGLGGRVGSGRQWFSWIHRDDWVRVARAALGLEPDTTLPDGPVVAAAPEPVRNAELMAALRRVLRRPAAPPTPAALLHVGAVALRSDPALALTGRHCTSQVLADAGFVFEHPHLDDALGELYRG